MPAKKKRAKKAKGAKLSPIPSGFHAVTPYLTVSGAAEAIEFYKKAFGARELARNTTPDGKILNARIRIGDSIVMMSDEFPGSDMKSPTSGGTSTVTLHIYSNNVDRLWQQAISAGAKVAMALDNQFWGERYGQLADPFGHRWSLSMQVKMSRQEMEAKQQAAMAMFAQGEHPGRTDKTSTG
jgi:PhnB protein